MTLDDRDRSTISSGLIRYVGFEMFRVSWVWYSRLVVKYLIYRNFKNWISQIPLLKDSEYRGSAILHDWVFT